MSDFGRNVFINCPLDKEYKRLLLPFIFTVLSLRLNPRLALESSDAAEPRIEKIIRIIAESQFGIHDLSRCKALKKGEISRLNMPLELGLDIGCRRFKKGKAESKRCLILEAERYRYQTAISDLSNSDIFCHDNEPELLIKGVRDWLVQEADAPPKSASSIQGAFLDFMASNYSRLQDEGYKDAEINAMPVIELKTQMQNWIHATHPFSADGGS